MSLIDQILETAVNTALTFDKNGDGTLSKVEFKNFCLLNEFRKFNILLTDEGCAKLFDQFDVNYNGNLSKVEGKELIRNVAGL
jgi:hypothetical protein